MSEAEKMEDIEIERYRTEIADDIDHLLRKYCRIMSWDIPELDGDLARKRIVEAAKQALAAAENKY